MKLTYAAALALEPGQVLRCEQVTGLQLRARKTERIWWYYYRYHGLQRYLRLGVFPALSVDGAREAARAHARAVARGEDPSKAKADALTAPTVLWLWETYRRVHIAKRCKRDTAAVYDSYYNCHISKLAGRRVVDIELADIDKLLMRIGRETPVTANRVRALLSAMFEYAESNSVKMRPYGSNPVRRSHLFREFRRRRHITVNEFPAIGASLRTHAAVYPREVAAILCTLLAGSRVTELAKAKRHQLDLAASCVTLTEHKTERTGEDRVIWLPRQASALIADLPDDGSGYLFGRGLDRFNLRRVWLKIVTQAGCPDVRLQDLRRTFASVAKTRGVGLAEIGEMLGHKQPETTTRYAFLFEQRAATVAQETGDAISGMLDGPRGTESPKS